MIANKTKTNALRLCCGLFTVGSLICNVTLLLALHKTNQQHMDQYNDWKTHPQQQRQQQRQAKQQPPSPAKRRYLAFDEAAPRVIAARSHHLPDAIPPHRVIPRQFAENEAYHLSKRTNTTHNSIIGEKGTKRPFYSSTANAGHYDWQHHNYTLDHRALYLYNPSVLPLTNHINTLHNPLSDADLLRVTGGDERVAYLATFRTNTGGNCFGSDRVDVMKTGEQLSYLAVALLDADLQLIPHTDVLIDLNAGPASIKYFQQNMEDCKILNLRGGLYLLCNEQLMRVQITRQNATTKAQQQQSAKLHTRNDTKLPYLYPNIYGNGLEVTLLSRQKIAGGKNFNVFFVPNPDTHETDYYLQTFPLPHEFSKLDVPAATDLPIRHVRKEIVPPSNATIPPPSFDGPDTRHVITTCPENDIPGSKTWVTNCTKPRVRPFFGNRDHGTFCCVKLTLPNDDNKNTTVLVGVSHTKTSVITNPWWLRDIYNTYRKENAATKIGPKRYLSRLVAYQAHPPFDIVARSGWFCMGFGDDASDNGGNTLAGRNRPYRLDLFATDTTASSYDCPMVHFVSGIAEHAGDATRAVLSYGVADCYPRIVVVDKQDLADRLLPMVVST